jgi:hypothetical protein
MFATFTDPTLVLITITSKQICSARNEAPAVPIFGKIWQIPACSGFGARVKSEERKKHAKNRHFSGIFVNFFEFHPS